MRKYNVTHFLALPFRVKNIYSTGSLDAAKRSNEAIADVIDTPYVFENVRKLWERRLWENGLDVDTLDWDGTESVQILVDRVGVNGDAVVEESEWFDQLHNKVMYNGDAGVTCNTASKVIQKAFVLLSVGDTDSALRSLAEWLDKNTSEGTSPISRRAIKEVLS